MNYPHFPCFYHPISILFLDDQEDFLASVDFSLGKTFQVVLASKISEARQALKKTVPELGFLKEIDRNELDIPVSYPIDVDVSQVYKMIYNPDRFAQIGIIMVDYDMPEMNGVDFCRSIQDMNVIKVLLTAEEDYALAVEAFNQGLIDHFIQKNSQNLLEQLRTVIQTLTVKHFQSRSWLLIKSLGEKTEQFLQSRIFREKFEDLMQKYRAREYYLLDRFGSFLFVDDRGHSHVLAIRSAEEMREQYSMADNLEAPQAVIEALGKKEGLLFFLTENEQDIPCDQWGSFLLKAECLSPEFYHAVVEGSAISALDSQRLLSYAVGS